MREAWSSILNTKAKGYISGVNTHENVQKLRRKKSLYICPSEEKTRIQTGF